ncbi:hypothetical protein GHT06_012491 [Daphnia sinensis]|uniref:Unconventional myosin-XVIIIa n=1 Tax=Daphnia sinensis TaxID=1820382 RepID=A0AAD5KYG9_9CRUS|nr:hypothetical protein GHT06_012491 [Daphnia sinensis]
MFSFMKKDKADKRDKKERKETKKPQTKDAVFQASGSGSGGILYGASAASASSSASGNDKLTADELLRLDEVRRSLKIRTRRKEKEKLPSGITADYTAHLGLHLVDGGLSSTNAPAWPELHSPISDGGSCTSDGTPSLNSLTSSTVTTSTMMMKQETFSVTTPMPVPPARGILKGKSSYGLESPPLLELDDDNKLVENTLKNELIIYEKPPAVLGTKKALGPAAHSALPPPLPKSQPPLPANGAFQRAKADARVQEEDTFTYSCPRPQVAPLDAATAAAIAAAAGLVPAESSRPSGALSATAKSSAKLLWSEPPGEGSGWLDRIKTHKSLHSSSSSLPSSLPLPALFEPALPEPRDLTLQRKETGDFGFSLRRSVVVERSPNDPSRNSVKRTVIFAEPVTGNTNKQLDAALLPGDRLLEVNGQNVQNTNREDIIDIIRNSGSTVTLKVQPVAELVELSRRWAADGRQIRLNDVIAKGGTLRRTGSLRHRHTKAKSDDELTKEKEWIESGRVWLQHRDGFTSARLDATGDAPVEEGRVRLKLDGTGEVVSVDEDEVVKANPPQFDLAEDLAQLRHLNEASLLHTLRCRYAASLPHTYAGQSLIVINPVTPLAVYSERMIQLFRGCKSEDMPPHIYSSAQSAYRSMLATRSDQSLIFVGRSGSGKSHNFRNSLHYLCLAAGCPSKVITVEKLNAIFLLLEAFGNCRTGLNTNATRFTNIFSLDFDQSGQIASGSIQVLMPERERVTRRPEGEPSFNVFYELVAGATGELRRYLQLENISSASNTSEQCAFMTPLQSTEDRQKAAVSYARLVAALESLGVAETDSRCIWSILAAIYHLGVAGAMRGATNNKIVFARPAAAQRAAILLGIGSLEELAQMAFYATPVQGLIMNGRSSFRTASPVHESAKSSSLADKHLDPTEALEGFAQGLYVEAFSALVALINRSISSTARTISSIVAIDTPGFQNPGTTSNPMGERAATFQDLCHNYTQERLQLLFHDTHITAQLNRYAQEHIDITLESGTGEEEMPSPEPLVDLLDRSPQSAVARAQSATNLRDVERRGFLWLLDDEALVSTTSEDELLDKLSAMYNDRAFDKLFTRPEGVGSRKQLMIHHGQGTNSVLYDLDGWLKSAREIPTTRNAALALTESTKEEMASLFRSCRGPLPTTVTGSVAGIEGSQSLRRASSIRRTFTSGTAGIKRKSLALQLKFQVDGLIETLRRTKPRFVYCFIPNHRAGLVDSSSSTFASNDDSLQVPLLRSQLRGSELLPAIRLYRQGYPDYMPLGEFVRRFNVLVPPDALPASLLTGLNSSTASEKQAAEILLLHIDLERSSYRLGLSQVFFRPGVLSQLEDQRDEKITSRVVKFQAQCRGFLARKRLSKLKVQDVAIRCIQRNVRKLQAIRVWPWWRLMLRLSPLLNVHRTEEELKARTEEAESLRSRVTALEKERADLKYVADRLETKVRTHYLHYVYHRSRQFIDICSVQLDLEMRGERLAALTKELDEMTTEGRSDADMAALRRAKHELEMKEEELDELAGQVQLLESARLRLEMAMEQMKKENKKELAQREEEIEDTRCSAQKKVKALEAQLESEHEERTLLVREKHELERQLLSMAQHAAHAADDDTIQKLKRDLKRTKALLKDAHSQLERCRSETPSKVLLRQLKNQLEDSEFARTAAVKGRQHAEQELLEAQQQLDEALRLRGETEDKYLSCNRERSNYQSQVDDLEVELNEVMRKYKAAVAQLTVDQITLQDQTAQLMSLEHEKSALKEQVAELSARLECLEIDTKSVHTQKRMELKVKELESRVELEQTSKSRLETQVARLKDMLDKSNLELDSLRCKEQLSQESSKRLQRQLRDVREELTGSEQRDADTSQQLRELEQRIELLESENATLVKDLSLALRRIEDLQVAMQGEMDTSDSDQDPHSAESDDDSDTSFHTFLSQRKYGSTSGVSSASDARRQSPMGLDSPSSSRVDLTLTLEKQEDESVA